MIDGPHDERRRRTRFVGALVALALLAVSTAFVGSAAATGVGAGVPRQPQPQPQAPVRVVTLGDSYISGNGAGAYGGPAGCYRSARTFPQVWVDRLVGRGVDASHVNAACSGARTRHIPGQIADASAALAEATHVFVSIGGNDAGFGDIVFQCLFQRDRADCPAAVDRATALLPELTGRIEANLRDIAAAAPGAVVVLVGYPLLVGANTYRLPGYEAGNAIRTLGALAERSQLAMVQRLNAEDPGRWLHLGLHDVYAGHELGGADRDWIRNIGLSLLRAEWVHPTATGHAATATAIDELPGFVAGRTRPSPGDSIVVPGGAVYRYGADGFLRRVPPAEVGCVAGGSRLERSRWFVWSLPIDRSRVSGCGGERVAGSVSGDLDGDRIGDLVVGAPGESVGSATAAGAITVLSGGPTGVSAAGAVQLHRDSPGVPGDAASGASWGSVTTTGDFDGDGIADLVVGVPGDDVDGVVDAGSVTVLPGSSAGWSAEVAGAVALHQGAPGIPEDAEPGDGFGGAVAAGDFDDDGFDDLAVGIAGEGLRGRNEVGAVVLLWGGPGGLGSGRSGTVLTQESADVPGSNETGDRFGASLAVGDLDGDGVADLVVGAPGEGIGDADGAGAVTVAFGSSGGLRGAVMVHQGTPQLAGVGEAGDGWGTTVAVGDVDGDGIGDLVVGTPRESVRGVEGVGAVTVVPGAMGGPDAARSVLLHQDGVGIPGFGEAGDAWGDALAVGDLDGDGIDELVVGAPRESVLARSGAGAVTTIDAPLEPGSRRAVLWHQGVARVPDVNEVDDAWGASLRIVDLDGDGRVELVVGAPGETVRGVPGAGAVTVFVGTDGGPVAAGSRQWHQDRRGVPDRGEPGDRWGAV